MTPQSLLSIAVRQVMLSPIKSEEPEAIKALSDLQRQILDLIPKHPAKITTPQVAELSGISVEHARHHLARLRRLYLIDSVAADLRNQPAKWSRP